MKVLLTVAMAATLNAGGVEPSGETKQENHSESKRCVKTYESIRQLYDNKTITIKEAQELWIKHRINEQDKER